jgi:glycosyltransferase involved in cell wall biosynthesis
LNTPELLDEFSRWHGPVRAKHFHAVTNGYDADFLEPYSRRRPGQERPFVLTHAGTLYGRRDPTPLLEALAKCIQDGRIPREAIRLQLIGKIVGQLDPGHTVRRLGLEGVVTQVPPVGHDACLRLLAASHVLIVIQPGNALQAPSKVYEYIGLRRPILALADEGAAVRLIKEARCGVVVSPIDVEAIANALCNLYQQQSQPDPANTRDSFTDLFDARFQSEKLEQIALRLLTLSSSDALAIATHG